MGGRGSNSKIQRRTPTPTPAAPPQQQPQQQQPAQPQTPMNQTPVVQNAVGVLSAMSDDQLAQLMRQSKGIDMPNHLNDAVDATQKFVYQAGLNEQPQVLDDAAFQQYLQDNNIPRSDILARSVGGANYTVNGVTMRLTPQQVTDIMKYSALNYVGGKHGGQVYGAGTYFDRNGGNATGYGNGSSVATAVAVLNPATARVIDKATLQRQIPQFIQSHPKFAREVGSSVSNNTLSLYALAMGYNVITDSRTNPSYHNVIDRAALVYRKSNV